MTNGIGNLPTAATARAATASDDNDRWLPKLPGQRKPSGLGPRPAPPAKPLTARPLSRDIDWNGHLPTAPRGPVSMTRAQVTAQLAQADADEPHERTAYESVVLGYGIPAHLTAFGGAA